MGTRHKGTETEVRALDAYIKLMRAADSITRRVQSRLDGRGLTISQFGVLDALHHLGPMCQRALGEKILKSTGNITMVVDNLEKRGFVRRERDAQDRRYVTVRLTPEGEALIASIFPGHAEAITGLMSALGPSEQEELSRLCRTLGRAAAA